MIDVLIVDDSPTARFALSELIGTTHDMRVVGEAENGEKAVSKTRELRPHVILMDLFMPEVDGIRATQAIMEDFPTPIVIMSGGLSDQKKNSEATIQAMRHGALTVLQKPQNLLASDTNAEAKSLLKTIRTMSSVRVIHHRMALQQLVVEEVNINSKSYAGTPRIVVVGVSTGGPGTLATLLKGIPEDFPLPIVVVQHITQPFLLSLVQWLDTQCALKVTLAQENQIPQAGNVYFAPIGQHLTITKLGRFALAKEPAALHTPSVDVLFNSVADAYHKDAIGVLLTGMGVDGAQGLKTMLGRGAYTIAQDEATSVVYGMPREAAVIGATRQIASIQTIAAILVKLTKNRKRTS
jgi:two-component system, chemotaxis family, protein-glutamate methylesterase/glutaminase